MNDAYKTREQLLEELALLRQSLAASEEQAPTTDSYSNENTLEYTDGLFEAPIWVEKMKERRARKSAKRGRFQVRIPDKYLRTIFDSSPACISVATDTSCRVIRHNPAAARFLRIEPWVSLSIELLTTPAI